MVLFFINPLSSNIDEILSVEDPDGTSTVISFTLSLSIGPMDCL